MSGRVGLSIELKRGTRIRRAQAAAHSPSHERMAGGLAGVKSAVAGDWRATIRGTENKQWGIAALLPGMGL